MEERGIYYNVNDISKVEDINYIGSSKLQHKLTSWIPRYFPSVNYSAYCHDYNYKELNTRLNNREKLLINYLIYKLGADVLFLLVQMAYTVREVVFLFCDFKPIRLLRVLFQPIIAVLFFVCVFLFTFVYVAGLRLKAKM